MRRFARVAAVATLGLGLATGATAAWIPAKAALAQVLLEDAWRRAQAGESQPTPWPWADAWPVARLAAPEHGKRLVVLSDASGRALAFGPGQLSGTSAPGHPGVTVVAGHRDTHFEFLRDLQPGDRLELEDREGVRHGYRAVSTAIVRADQAGFVERAGPDRLALVTCWPFDAVRPGGPLRYVVMAERDAPVLLAQP
ncbi:MAG: class GN sortase [Deltaproteobacteria bacterium]|nr:class GN sortase [Deltaproteobacteria bacterium]MBW2447791.1 class GN sortase [Deltaproteobacteria bacterium]